MPPPNIIPPNVEPPLNLPKFTFLHGSTQPARNVLAANLASLDDRLATLDFLEPIRRATIELLFSGNESLDLTRSPTIARIIRIDPSRSIDSWLSSFETFIYHEFGPTAIGRIAYHDLHASGLLLDIYDRFIFRDTPSHHACEPFATAHGAASCLYVSLASSPAVESNWPPGRHIWLSGAQDAIAQLRSQL